MSLTYEHILRGTIACGECGNNLHRNENSTLQCLNSKCEHWRVTFAEPRIQLEIVLSPDYDLPNYIPKPMAT